MLYQIYTGNQHSESRISSVETGLSFSADASTTLMEVAIDATLMEVTIDERISADETRCLMSEAAMSADESRIDIDAAAAAESEAITSITAMAMLTPAFFQAIAKAASMANAMKAGKCVCPV